VNLWYPKRSLLIFLWLVVLVSTFGGLLQSSQAGHVSQAQEAAGTAAGFTVTGEPRRGRLLHLVDVCPLIKNASSHRKAGPMKTSWKL